jgi:hypothetical protein
MSLAHFPICDRSLFDVELIYEVGKVGEFIRAVLFEYLS